MTREEAIELLKEELQTSIDNKEDFADIDGIEKYNESLAMAIKALEQEPSGDLISRQAVMDCFKKWQPCMATRLWDFEKELSALPSVTPQEPKTGHCKDCKYFEYDSVAKVDGIPLIVAHEICSRWGNGCKTKEDGYCFLFESKESEDKE